MTIDLATLHLAPGSHSTRAAGVCFMEAVAWFAGEPHSDHPECASAVIAVFCRVLNDNLDDVERQELVAYVPRLVGSKASPEIELKRAFIAADFALRSAAPAALRAGGLEEEAVKLGALAPIIDRDSARAAAATAAGAVRAAAWEAVRAAAAAVRAAESAAWAAAWEAEWAAAWAAAAVRADWAIALDKMLEAV